MEKVFELLCSVYGETGAAYFGCVVESEVGVVCSQ